MFKVDTCTAFIRSLGVLRLTSGMLEREATLWDGAHEGKRKDVKKQEENTEALEEGCSFLVHQENGLGWFQTSFD